MKLKKLVKEHLLLKGQQVEVIESTRSDPTLYEGPISALSKDLEERKLNFMCTSPYTPNTIRLFVMEDLEK